MMTGSRQKGKCKEVMEGKTKSKVILTGMQLYMQHKFHSIKGIQDFSTY